MIELEIWKDIEGFEGLYKISSLGRIYSVERIDKYGRKFGGCIRKPQKTKCGYYIITLCKKSIYKSFLLHRLVAKHFIPNPNNYPCIDHIDTDRANNKVSNLRWVSHSMNSLNPITRKRQSECKRGNRFCLGRRLSIETKQKIGKSNSTPVIATNIKSGVEKYYESVRKACAELGCSSGNVSACCLGKRNQTKGYMFRYAC